MKVVITLTNHSTDYDLTFELINASIADRWVKHLDFFIQAGQPWDDVKRFYNFQGSEYTETAVVAHIQKLVNTIKEYAPSIINREITGPLTQDDLNYLHHIFEMYHGLYDQQDKNDFFKHAPTEVQTALGDLNIWIHRYETLGGMPRFVGTWKYKPYRDLFEEEDFKLFSLYEEWGDLRINYCEIGKTLYDFYQDNDQYILPEAFQPHHHYCFDFTVRFTRHSAEHYKALEDQVWNYFDQHQTFFNDLGYYRHDPKLSLGGITIGKLVINDSRQKIEDEISKHQCFKQIRLLK